MTQIPMEPTDRPVLDFVRQIITDDVVIARNGGRVATRFPPEPNGYLHIGHAKSICLNFGLAREFNGTCNLRFDDTNPTKEDIEYVESIKQDIQWLGFQWNAELYASDYFEQLFLWAEHLIENDLAYVDGSTVETISRFRGTVSEPGRPTPDRDRPRAENLDLFHRMRAGEFPEGSYVLRAKVDLASPNMLLRDPILYRIRHASHHRTGDRWCIYPLYDWAHGQCDAIEGITHSICTLEFEVHRPLYDWFLDNVPTPCHPRQIEFARLNLSYTMMSKRKLLILVQEGHVAGWDDPRMPTLRGLRRRGVTPEALRTFSERIGLARNDNMVEIALLEHCIREDLNERTPRVMAVLRPLKVVLDNWPEDQVEEIDMPFHPDHPEMGSRRVLMTRELFIEREDFMEDPPKKYFRLAIGREVRLRGGYFMKCEGVVRDPATGEIVELRCTVDPETRGGAAPSDGRKVKGTIHWVSATKAVPAEVRLYDRLFTVEDPASAAEDQDFRSLLNPGSLEVIPQAWLEPFMADAITEGRYQFERTGYFCVDPDSTPDHLVLNRTVTLRDSWSRAQAL